MMTRPCDMLPPVRGSLTLGAPLKDLVWFRAGGPAGVLFRPADADDLASFLLAKPADLRVSVIGVGSNLLVRDGGIPGAVVRLATPFEDLDGADGFFGQAYAPLARAIPDLERRDLIVIAGNAGVEQAGREAGDEVSVPFNPGRGDATQEETDVESFEALSPRADGFRNWSGGELPLPAEYMLLDRANLLNLSAPEMTVLVGGMRVLGANQGGSELGVLTGEVGSLTNDFFVNLLDLDTKWEPVDADATEFEGKGPDGEVKWKASRVDLIFGSNSELRALAEVYGSDDAKQKFAEDFAAAWAKVMDLDRFDLR